MLTLQTSGPRLRFTLGAGPRRYDSMFSEMSCSWSNFRFPNSAGTQQKSPSGDSQLVCCISTITSMDSHPFFDISGAGSVIQHVVAQGGKTRPPLFRSALTSSTFLPSQYHYNDRIPEVWFLIASVECFTSPHITRVCFSDFVQRSGFSGEVSTFHIPRFDLFLYTNSGSQLYRRS